MPRRSSSSISLPACASTCSTKPAKISISRRWNGRCASGMLSHAGIDSARGVSFGVGRNPAELLLAREHALAIGVPAVVELALVLVGPLLADLVRPVRRAGRPVHEERLVGREGAVLAQPVDAALRQVLAQVVLLVVRRLDGVGVLDQPRLPLRGLAGEEAVEVVEAVAGRPAVERAHRRGLVGRRVVPLAERRRLVAVVAQHLGHRRRGLRDHAGVAVPVDRALGDRAVADALVVAPGEQRGARRRADRRGVEGVVADALARRACSASAC